MMETFPKTCEEFSLMHHQNVYTSEIAEYVSSLCGLRVLFARMQRPLLDSIFLVPTQPNDNTGCAHALEHLIFLGSQQFKYRGFLDALATRCLAETTNAWTSVDHTAYTITTAGYKGFFNIFPVYLDHIMHPLITESSLLTEIHHLNEHGCSEGVVYSELEATEFQCSEVVSREIRRRLYPGKCGYSFDAGGHLNEVKKLDRNKICDFHQKFYRWDNLSIILIGMIPVEQFLKQLSRYLRSINAARSPQFTPPWTQTHFEDLSAVVPSTVYFPTASAQDDFCDLVLAWRGAPWSNFRDRLIVEVMGHYLCSSFASPLENAFVNIPFPKCSGTYFSEEAFQVTYYSITFSDVKKKNLNQIRRIFTKVITDLCTNGVDLRQMRATISLVLGLFEHELEESPEDGLLIIDFYHGDQPFREEKFFYTRFFVILGDIFVEYLVNTCGKPQVAILQDQWNLEDVLDKDLMSQSQDFWKKKFEEHFLSSPTIEVRGVPDFQLSKKIEIEKKKQAKKEKEWIQTSQRGQEYLSRLHEARATTVDIPRELLESFESPCFTDVQTFNPSVFRNFQTSYEKDDTKPHEPCSAKFLEYLQSLPIPVHFVATPSQFLEARLLIRLPLSSSPNAEESKEFLTNEEMTFLPLFCELLFHSNVKTTYMKSIPHDSETQLLDDQGFAKILLENLVGHRVFLGITGDTADVTTFPELLTIYLCAQKTRIVQLGEILLSCLKSIIFSESSLASISRASLTRILRRKRKATTLLRAARTALRYSRESLRVRTGLLQQQETLRRIAKNPEIYVEKFQTLYSKVFRCVQQNVVESPPLVLHLVGPYQLLVQNPPFQQILKDILFETHHESSPFNISTLPEILQLPSPISQRHPHNASKVLGNALVMESSSVEGSCLTLSCQGTGYDLSPDPVHLLALAELLSNGDGLLFNSVRGSGSAYGASLDVDFFSQELLLHLRNCSDSATAFSVSLKLLHQLVEENDLFSFNLTENSKSSVFLRLLRAETTYVDFALEGLHNLCLGLPVRYSSWMIEQLQYVSPKTLQLTAQKYFSRFFRLLGETDSTVEPLLIVVTGHDKGRDLQISFSSSLKTEYPHQEIPEDYLHWVTLDQFIAWAVLGDINQTEQIQALSRELERNYDQPDSHESSSNDEEEEEKDIIHPLSKLSQKKHF